MQRSELINYYKRVRALTEKICAPLEVEDHVIQPVVDVSPPKWHLGHTTWFYEAMFLDKYLPNYKRYDDQYAFVFNSYYNSFGVRVDRDRRGSLSRPTVADIMAFRAEVDKRMVDLIDSVDESEWQQFSQTLVLGLNHEQQHQELLVTDIKYILASNPLRPAYANRTTPLDIATIAPAEWVSFEAGLFEIGYPATGFAYDNEFPVHKQYVNEFKLHNRLVTNGEFLEFVESGGYSDFRWWLSDAWGVVNDEHWRAPLYWEKIDNEWYEFTLFGLEKLNPSAPVCHVSFYEADAYAQFRSRRLPTEAEWEVAARRGRKAEAKGNFMDEHLLHPQPLAESSDSNTLYQMLGDVWEWTNSSYLPYPGYQRIEGPLGEYNGKFMIDQMVLRGGSCATSRDHVRITYRNFFQPDKRWQFKGIRLAE